MFKKGAPPQLVIPTQGARNRNNGSAYRQSHTPFENSARNKKSVKNLYEQLIQETNLNHRNSIKRRLISEIEQKIFRSGVIALNKSDKYLTLNQKRAWARGFLSMMAQLEISNINRKMNNFKTNSNRMKEDPFVWMSDSQYANILLAFLNPIRVR
jgi:hypothetical protein